MLRITIQETELWDEQKLEFVLVKKQTLTLEHSLISLSKWESKWHKSFLSTKTMTIEEIINYVECMTITQNVDPYTYYCLSNENIEEIKNYIDDPMTATVLPKETGPASRDTVTSELIYYWMIAANIPFECQKWHLNRLLMLIRVCGFKNKQPKKSNSVATANQYAALNAARKKKYNTKG